MKRFAATLVGLLLMCHISNGAPYNGTIFEFSQPDGEVVPVHVFGDEFYQIAETPEGFSVIRDTASGSICYARLSQDSSRLIPTQYRYITGGKVGDTALQKHLRPGRSTRIQQHIANRRAVLGADSLSDEPGTPVKLQGRSSPPAGIRPLAGVNPVRGSYTGLTVLIDFSDRPATVPVDSIEALLNKPGYRGYKNNGSVRDYFYEVSGGKVEYHNVVMGYYRAAKAKTYYESSSASFGVRAQELILEALAWVDKQGFDFTGLSVNERMRALAVNFMYAGTPSQGWSEGLWPHQGNLSTVTVDNIKIRRYQITNIGSDLNIGVFCHENGHMLFNWPDLYDYGEESSGVGSYCIMGMTDEKNPVAPCAYLRDFSGWDAVTDITGLPQGTTFTHIPNSNTSFVYRNSADANEMFYLEGRRKSGRSRMLPDSGFMILHVDKNGSNDNESGTASSHYLVAVEQADNTFDLEKRINSGKAGDLFRKGYRDNFSDSTKPDAHWWSGKSSGLNIASMSAVADTMSFSMGSQQGTRYTIAASAGPNGNIVPSGKITVAAGSSLSFVITPDSGYQVESLVVDGAKNDPVSTLAVTGISSDKVLAVTFGIASGIHVVVPQRGQTCYAGDTITVAWHLRAATIGTYQVSLSSDGGGTYVPVKATVGSSDSSFRWIVPPVNSTACVLKIADADGTPEGISGLFAIASKPAFSIDISGMLSFTVEKGKVGAESLVVTNRGSGDLIVSATSARQMKRVFVNELSTGADSDAPDAIELYNRGTAIDLSGWELSWEDNKATSGSYVFPAGFVFDGGATFLLHDDASLQEKYAVYAGSPLQWNYSDQLQLSVTLADPSGRGVDFVKSKGSADLPPEGAVWNGNGIDLCNSFVYRVSATDLDSAGDWSCGASGTLRKVNGGQDGVLPNVLSVFMEGSTIAGGKSGRCSIKIDAASLDIGTVTDMLVVFHNDPELLSPVRIPCKITVVAPASVKRTAVQKQDDLSGRTIFTAAPNVVENGSPVLFLYNPQGDESSGNITIFSGSGNVIASVALAVEKIDLLNKAVFTTAWKPSGSIRLRYSSQTLLARLLVQRMDGTKKVVTTKFVFK